MTPRTRDTVPDLVSRARDGEVRAVARLISLVEDESPLLREAMAALAPFTGRARIIGVTGAPGVGKSTSTSALVARFRSAGKRVGVLAVDSKGGGILYANPAAARLTGRPADRLVGLKLMDVMPLQAPDRAPLRPGEQF